MITRKRKRKIKENEKENEKDKQKNKEKRRENYKIKNFEDLELDHIHSVEFINSLCFIKKKSPEHNKIGKRIVVGESATVVPDRKKYDNTNIEVLNQNNNPWSNSELLPEEELALIKKKLGK